MFEIAGGILLAGAALVALVLFWPIVWRLAAVALVLIIAGGSYLALDAHYRQSPAVAAESGDPWAKYRVTPTEREGNAR